MATATSSPAGPVRVRIRPLANARGMPPRAGHQTTWRLAIAVVAGGLHATGWLFPGAWPSVWLAQMATIALAASCRPRQALGYGTFVGVIGIAASFYWGVAALGQTFDASPLIAWSIFVALVAFEGLAFGLFAWATSCAARAGVRWMWVVPCAWTAIEHWYPRVFPWKLGYSQLECLPLLQIAELAGPTSIGFVVTAAATAPIALWLAYVRDTSRRDRQWATGLSMSAGLLLAATLAFGFARIDQWSRWCDQQPKLKLALIQVDPIDVGAENKLRERSLAVHEQVDLICWPESALGTYCERLTHFRDRDQTERLSRQSRDQLAPAEGLSCHLLAGGKLYRDGAADDGPYSMTAFLISPEQDVLGRYCKRTLLPFGEYIPGQSWYPAVRDWATLGERVEAGADPAPLIMASGHKLGVVICYEDTLPRNARQTVAAGAEAIFSLIQGTAFENPLTLVQHQRLAALRAVENRRYFVRCSSTGVTCVFEPTGRCAAQLPPQAEGTLLCDIALISDSTAYERLGDWLPFVCTLAVALGSFFSRHQLRTGIHSADAQCATGQRPEPPPGTIVTDTVRFLHSGRPQS